MALLDAKLCVCNFRVTQEQCLTFPFYNERNVAFALTQAKSLQWKSLYLIPISILSWVITMYADMPCWLHEQSSLCLKQPKINFCTIESVYIPIDMYC